MIDVLEHLKASFFATLKNTDISNPKILVVFSGGNAVGKTSLAGYLAEHLGALVVSNDEVRREIAKVRPDMDKQTRNAKMREYVLWLSNQLPHLTTNGLVVADSVIDHHYEKALPLFNSNGYGLFVIYFSLSDAFNIELIKKRGDTTLVKIDEFIQKIPEHKASQARFRTEYVADYVIDDENFGNWQQAREAISERIQNIQNSSEKVS